MGRVVEAKVSRGNQVRECTVQTLSPRGKQISFIKRPPNCLVPLEGDPRKKAVSWNESSLLDNLANARGKEAPPTPLRKATNMKQPPSYRIQKADILNLRKTTPKKQVTFNLPYD